MPVPVAGVDLNQLILPGILVALVLDFRHAAIFKTLAQTQRGLDDLFQRHVLHHAAGAKIIGFLHQFSRAKIAQRFRALPEVSPHDRDVFGGAGNPFLHQHVRIHRGHAIVFRFQLLPTVSHKGLAAADRLPPAFASPQVRTHRLHNAWEAKFSGHPLEFICIMCDQALGSRHARSLCIFDKSALIQCPHQRGSRRYG